MDEERMRQVRVWLLVAAPPLITFIIGVLTGAPMFAFISLIWAVGAAAVALGYRSTRRVEPPPAAPALAHQPPAPPADTTAISSAIVRVASVKAEYGSLLGDIVYRIENSALFDDAQALTREFQLALMRWDDVQNDADPSTLQRVASEVELAFRTAKSNAETLGLSHLPSTAQPTAQRALKAAHLADGAGTESEREAALAQVAHLLDSLALYYLPSPADARRMLGGAHPELNGRPDPGP